MRILHNKNSQKCFQMKKISFFEKNKFFSFLGLQGVPQFRVIEIEIEKNWWRGPNLSHVAFSNAEVWCLQKKLSTPSLKMSHSVFWYLYYKNNGDTKLAKKYDNKDFSINNNTTLKPCLFVLNCPINSEIY